MQVEDAMEHGAAMVALLVIFKLFLLKPAFAAPTPNFCVHNCLLYMMKIKAMQAVLLATFDFYNVLFY